MKIAHIYLAGFLLMASVFLMAAILYEMATPEDEKPTRIQGEIRYG